MADLSTALQGIGAAFKGQAPQFLQQQQQRQQMERAQMLQNEDLAEKRRMTLFKDAAMMRANPEMAGSILQDRLAQIQRFNDMDVPVDPRHTQEMMQLYQSGDMDAFSGYLDNVIRSGQSIGAIAKPEAPTAYDPGQMIRMPDGSFKAVPVPEGYVDPDELKTERGKISGEAIKIRSIARDALDGYNKLDSLAQAVRNAQVPGASDEVRRAGRTALGTIQTLMARMASPGVVTEQDFRTQAGATSLRSEIINKLTTLGENDTNLAAVMASFDPTNPESVDVDLIIDQARSMTKGTATGLLNDFAGLRSISDTFNFSDSFKTAYFGGQSARNLGRLGQIADPNFDSKSYFQNPTEYLDKQEQALAAQPAMQIPGQQSMPGTPVYASQAEAQAAGERGEFNAGDVIVINGVKMTVGQ